MQRCGRAATTDDWPIGLDPRFLIAATAAANSWRTPPSRPRASPRIRASACGPGAQASVHIQGTRRDDGNDVGRPDRYRALSFLLSRGGVTDPAGRIGAVA